MLRDSARLGKEPVFTEARRRGDGRRYRGCPWSCWLACSRRPGPRARWRWTGSSPSTSCCSPVWSQLSLVSALKLAPGKPHSSSSPGRRPPPLESPPALSFCLALAHAQKQIAVVESFLPRPPPRSLLPLPVEILHHAIWTQEHRGAQSPTAALENTRDKGSSLSPPLSLTLLLSPAALSSPLKSLCHSSSKILVVPVRDLCRPWQLCAHSLSPEPCTALCKGLSGDQTTRRGLGSHSPLEDPTAKSIPMSQTGHSLHSKPGLPLKPCQPQTHPPRGHGGDGPPGRILMHR